MFSPLPAPFDDPDALAAALRSGADTLVFDLGDGDAPGDRAARRRAALEALLSLSDAAPRPLAVVRVAPLASGLVDVDLDAVMAGAPDAVMLPGVDGRADVQRLAAKLAVREAEHGRPAGTTGIVAVPADTAAGVMSLGSLPGASPRLEALVWDPAALAADLGAGIDASPVRAARDLLLLAAAAAGVPALDAGPPGDDLARACRVARRDGFSGRLARRPGEVEIIAATFGRRAR